MGRDILRDDIYEMDISAINLRDFIIEFEKEKERKKEVEEAGRDFEEELLDVKKYIKEVAWLPRVAIDCIYYFFVTIKNDMGITGYKIPTDKPLIVNRVLATISDMFLSDFAKGRDIEEKILDYIEDMREFILYPPIEDLEKELWELRSYKIEFFKRVLEEYRKNKEEYDKILENEIKARNDLKREIKEIDGHKGKKVEESILEEEKDSRILLEDTYEMNISAFNIRNLTIEIEKEKERRKLNNQVEHELDDEEIKEILRINVKYYRSNVASIPKIAIDCIYNFFISIKNDMTITGYKLDTLKVPRDSISTRVLNVLHKFSHEVKKGKDLEEIFLDYIEDMREFILYPPIEDLEKELWELRSYKIEFFKRVLEEYRKDKKEYDRRLKINVEARKADYERFRIKD